MSKNAYHCISRVVGQEKLFTDAVKEKIQDIIIEAAHLHGQGAWHPLPYSFSGVLEDDDTPANFIDHNAGALDEIVDLRAHYIQFVRVGYRWYVISDATDGEWKFDTKAKKVDEAKVGVDHNSDGDKKDKVWINYGSDTKDDNTGF